MSCRKIAAGLIVAGMVAAFGAGPAFAGFTSTVIDSDGNARTIVGESAEDLQEKVMAQERADFGVTSQAALLDMQAKLSKINKLTYSKEVRNARGELEQTLANPNADAKEIAEKLAAFRDVRAKAQAEADKVRDELKPALTPLQDASLLLKGMID